MRLLITVLCATPMLLYERNTFLLNLQVSGLQKGTHRYH